MKLDQALELARSARLYPGIILHGGDGAERARAGVELGRTLLCAAATAERPCGRCRHCRRIVEPGAPQALFHPDFLVLERDLKTSTSAEATRALLRTVQVRPFEARGQVFLVVSAETLSGGAADVLLKSLEEPPRSAPRHFLLSCPSAGDLLPTLRSRCLPVYLGAGARSEPAAELVEALAAQLEAARSSPAGPSLLGLARTLLEAGSFEDLRSAEPWTRAARALLELARREPPPLRGALLALAEELLAATEMRVRGIPAVRILDGLVARHLGPLGPGPGAGSQPSRG